MSQKIIVVGCSDDLALLAGLPEVECLTHEEATLRGLTAPTVLPIVPLDTEYRLLLLAAPVQVPRKESPHHHGYPGKRRGRRRY